MPVAMKVAKLHLKVKAADMDDLVMESRGNPSAKAQAKAKALSKSAPEANGVDNGDSNTKAKATGKPKAKAKAKVQAKKEKSKADVKAKKEKPASKAKAKAKGKAKAHALSQKTLAALAGLGGAEMSLDDKIAALRSSLEANGPDAAVGQAAALTRLDRSKIWQSAKTAMKTDPQLKEDYEKASETGKAAQSKVLLAWKLDPTCGNLYSHMTKSISNLRTVEKIVKWISQKQADERWTAEELEAHLNSGRVSARECPQTPGVWEYRDNFDVESKHRIEKKMENQAQTSLCDHDSAAHEEWNELFAGVDMSGGESLLRMADNWEFGNNKGKGKGSSVPDLASKKGRGKGAVKNGGVDPTPAPVPEKDPHDLAVTKCKQAIALVDKTDLVLNEDMTAMAKSAYMTPKIKQTFLAYMDKLSQAKKRLRGDLFKARDLDLEHFKNNIAKQISVVKEVQCFMRQHKGISSAKSQLGKDE